MSKVLSSKKKKKNSGDHSGGADNFFLHPSAFILVIRA
jgi:hypothetical protein